MYCCNVFPMASSLLPFITKASFLRNMYVCMYVCVILCMYVCIVAMYFPWPAPCCHIITTVSSLRNIHVCMYSNVYVSMCHIMRVCMYGCTVCTMASSLLPYHHNGLIPAKHTRMYACVYVYIYIYIYMYMNICIRTHTYIYTDILHVDMRTYLD